MTPTLAELHEAALSLIEQCRIREDADRARGYQGVPHYLAAAREDLIRALTQIRHAREQHGADEIAHRSMSAYARALARINWEI